MPRARSSTKSASNLYCIHPGRSDLISPGLLARWIRAIERPSCQLHLHTHGSLFRPGRMLLRAGKSKMPSLPSGSHPVELSNWAWAKSGPHPNLFIQPLTNTSAQTTPEGSPGSDYQVVARALTTAIHAIRALVLIELFRQQWRSFRCSRRAGSRPRPAIDNQNVCRWPSMPKSWWQNASRSHPAGHPAHQPHGCTAHAYVPESNLRYNQAIERQRSHPDQP